MSCLIVFKSITYAQSAIQLMRRSGVSAGLVKTTVALGDGSCSYAVRVLERDLERARNAISGMNLMVTGVYRQTPQGGMEVIGF